MDEMSVIEARRDANLANLRRAFQAPVQDDLSSAFGSLLARLSDKGAAGLTPSISRYNQSQVA